MSSRRFCPSIDLSWFSVDWNLFSESAIHSCWERLRFTRSLVETVTSLTPSSPSFSLSPPLKIQKADRMRPPPATPARSSRDRQSVVEGTRGPVRVDLGGRGLLKPNKRHENKD